MTQKEAINIRPLGFGDAEGWSRLWHSYLTEHRFIMRSSARRALLRQLTSQNGRDGALIAEVGGQPVGFAHYRIKRAPFLFENALYLHDVFVLPTCRGTGRDTGVAASLIRAVYATAYAQEVPGVYWLDAPTKLLRSGSAPALGDDPKDRTTEKAA